jgi:glycosyltransferase involved in cell wall biosynthesis
MKIGAAFEPNAAAFYRGVYPLDALQRRGHEIVWPEQNTGKPIIDQLWSCDAVYVYRGHHPSIHQLLTKLAHRGIAIVWDNDDNLQAIPRDSPTYREVGGLRAQKRFTETVKVARLADATLVTTEPLREVYEKAGVGDVHVIENYLPHKTKRKPRRHDGLVVGWVAGEEHLGDAKALGLAATLTRLQHEHPDLQVACVGVDLGLGARYHHVRQVHFNALPEVIAGWDIGLAPLLDSPFNRSRSNIKVKEYAATSVPWLASAFGPYAELGEGQGGRLVADDRWPAALDALIRDQRARKKLAKAGRSWAKGQTIDAVAGRYEAIFQEAVERAAHRVASRRAALA